MFNFKRIRPLTHFPLNCFFNSGVGRNCDLYDLRLGAVRKDGFFLIECDPGDYFNSSFSLTAPEAGNYILGVISPSPSRHPDRKDCFYYEIFIHGGNRDATMFCRSESELVDTLRDLEESGMKEVFTNNGWEAAVDLPFDKYFNSFPNDERFIAAFGDNVFAGMYE